MPVDEVARLEAALRSGLAGLPHVAGAWLFGSRALGRARAESDIDVAILFSPERPQTSRLETLREIAAALGAEVSTAALDLVVLDDAPVALAFQVLKHGRLLVAPDARTVHRFRVRVYREHSDRAPVERFFRHATRARAQRAASGG